MIPLKPSIDTHQRQMTWPFSIDQVIWLLIGVGVLLRTVQYGLNISLWIDEAFISLNVINRSFLELLQPLDYRQGAPYGFLLLEKLAVSLLGTQEWVLRLVPFLAGVTSLWLFRSVALALVSPAAAAIALGLFVFSDRLIYFSAEVKQYSTDVAVALLLYWVIIRGLDKPLRWQRAVGIALLGAIALWFSHPAVFALAGIGLTLVIRAIQQQGRADLQKYIAIFTVWLSSFVGFYWITLRPLTQNEALQDSFGQKHGAFMPLPTSLESLNWYVENFLGFFNDPVGIPAVALAACFFVVGLCALWRSRPLTMALLLMPIGLTLLASGLQQYPFKARLILFLVPFAILILAEGARLMAAQLAAHQRFIGALLIVALFFQPVHYAVNNLRSPAFITDDSSYQRVREHFRPVIAYLQDNRQPGDVIYIYYAAQYAFRYYLEQFDFEDLIQGESVWPEANSDWFEPALPSYPPQLIVGAYARGDWSVFQSELEAIKGNSRVWVLFTHVRDRRSSIDEEDIFLHLLDQAGVQKDTFSDIESYAYLYDLSS